MSNQKTESAHSVGCGQWRSKGDWRECICAKDQTESDAPCPRCGLVPTAHPAECPWNTPSVNPPADPKEASDG